MNPSVEGSGVEAMRKLQAVPCAALLLFIMVTQAQAQSLMTHHTRPAVTSGQAKFLNRLPETQTLRIDIVLPMHDQAGLDELLQELYDPASPAYRHFLTVPEFTARFGPTQEEYETVLGFAKSYGFTVLGGSRDAMDVQLEGSVTSIELAFNVSMGAYQHPTEGRTFYAPDREPTVALPFGVWHVSGLDNYSIPHPALVHSSNASARSNATTGSGPSASFLGSDMRAAYYGTGSLTGSGQYVGLLEYYGTDLADLTTYFTNAHQTNNVPVTLISTDGTSTSCVSPRCDDTEQTLDITQALGLAPGLAGLYMFVGSSDTAIFSSMTSHSPLPLALSSSWTWTPADPSTDDPYFKRMASQGQSFYQASGDAGAWKTTSYFPSDDANVICVGGTDLTTNGAGGPWSGESAWVDGGGGISPDKLPIGSYQEISAVTAAGGSATLRNGPDVSANANFTYYVCADQTTCTANEYGGTSFAAPLWAGYTALANQQAKANGASAVGFLNPIIYPLALTSAYSTDFHDIVSGSNGYSAITGYDLATGWGSMNGAALINALSGPPTPNFSISASPSTVTVVQGSNGTSTITTTALNGFSSAISLSAAGEPSNVTVGFGTTTIPAPGSGTSIITLTVASGVATGTYPITVSGTSGSTVNTATVTLTVTAPVAPNFTLSASPTSVTITRGSSGTSTITTTVSGGFSSAIALSANGQSSGITVSFNPTSIAAPGAGKSTVTFRASSSASTGTRTITITGTGGGKSHTATVSLTVRR